MPFLVLLSTGCMLGGFLIFIQPGNTGLMGNFLWAINTFSQKYCCLASPGKSWAYHSSHSSTWRSSSCLGGCVAHKAARVLFMRIWDIFETSSPGLTQEQYNQNTVQVSSYYTLRRLHDIYSNRVRLAEATSAPHRGSSWWAKNGVERWWRNEVSGPPFLRLAPHSHYDVIWPHSWRMTGLKKQFSKDMKCKPFIMLEIE